MISAIDLGFMYTKAIVDGKRVMMKSVVGNGKAGRFDDLNVGLDTYSDHIKARVGAENYFVSDLAIQQSDTVYHSLKENRFDSFATEILIHSSFGLCAGSVNSETKIVSGLPVSHYATYKNEIRNLFLGRDTKRHNFEIENNNKLIKGTMHAVQGEFIPQPFGAMLDRLLDWEGNIQDRPLAMKTIAVVDPGFGTTDVYVANALKPIERLTFSTKTAMNHAYRLISNKIDEQFGVTLQLHDIEKIVSQGYFKKSGKKYHMDQAIKWAYQSTAEQLVSEIVNKWKTIHEIDHILLAGGGGQALSKWILPEFPNIELLDNSQWSVVNGYYKWGVRKFD